MTDSQQSTDFQRALEKPSQFFDDPDQVLNHPDFTPQQKIQILTNWELQQSSLAEKEGRGMPRGDAAEGGEMQPAGQMDETLRRVRLALETLTTQQGGGTPSTSPLNTGGRDTST
jgi:hypothetical protein